MADSQTRLVEGTDYTVAYENNVAIGLNTARAIVTGKGAYSGTLTATFTIKGNLAQASVSLPGTYDLTYNGEPRVPVPEVRLVGNTLLTVNSDYTVKYSNNVNAGIAQATVTGTGLYYGEVTINFTIMPKSIKGSQTSPIAAMVYNGIPQTPSFTVTDGTKVLMLDQDYTVAYNNNVNAGTAHVIITGMGNYRDSLETTFVINKVEMRSATVIMPNMIYTGNPLYPHPESVTVGNMVLQEGVDYDIVGYGNNVQPGDAQVTLQGKGNFTGAKVANWKVVQQQQGGGTSPNAGNTQTLPQTGDDTNPALIIGGIAAGVVLIGAGTGLVIYNRKKRNK